MPIVATCSFSRRWTCPQCPIHPATRHRQRNVGPSASSSSDSAKVCSTATKQTSSDRKHAYSANRSYFGWPPDLPSTRQGALTDKDRGLAMIPDLLVRRFGRVMFGSRQRVEMSANQSDERRSSKFDNRRKSKIVRQQHEVRESCVTVTVKVALRPRAACKPKVAGQLLDTSTRIG